MEMVSGPLFTTPNFFIIGAGPGENIEPVDLPAFVQASMLVEIPYFVLRKAGEVLSAVWLIERYCAGSSINRLDWLIVKTRLAELVTEAYETKKKEISN